MKVYKLTYENGVEYYPVEEGKCGTYLDSAWRDTMNYFALRKVEEIEVKRLWFVKMNERIWDESESVWITKEDRRVSPYRLTEQEVDADFNQLGCIDLRENKLVSAQSIIVPGYLWVQFMVQCKSVNHCD